MKEFDLSWAKAELQMIQAIQSYNYIKYNYVLNGFVLTTGHFREQAKEFQNDLVKKQQEIEALWKELFGTEKKFDAIYQETEQLMARLKANTAEVEYPDENITQGR